MIRKDNAKKNIALMMGYGLTHEKICDYYYGKYRIKRSTIVKWIQEIKTERRDYWELKYE